MLSSVFTGEEDRRACHRTFKSAWVIGFTSNAVLAALIALFATPIARLYTGDAQVVASASLALRFVVLSMPLASLISVVKNFYQPIGRLAFARLIQVVEFCVFRVVPAAIIAMAFGIVGAFWLYPLIAETATLIMIVAIIWGKTGHFPRTVDDFMFLPASFGAAPGNHLDFAARNKEDVLNIKDIAYDFCIVRNNDEHVAARLSLFVEEMCMNIIDHGFSDGKRDHEMHIRMLYHDDGYILRIRDDCKPFDPVEWMELHSADEEDPTKNIGIRIVSAMAKEITYTRTLDLNNLIVRI